MEKNRYNKGEDKRSDKNVAITRTYTIYADLVQMKSVAEIEKKYTEEWGIGRQTVNKYICNAYEIFDKNMQKEFERLATNQLTRIMYVGSRALEEGKLDTALKASDIINKLAGLYVDKVEANVSSDSTIHVSFDGIDFSPKDEIDETIDQLSDNVSTEEV
jgi:Rps23 Pro-64 3,4-dihydroxylase Tpa1-like proline 4-hydroxylase